jgi:hypothetical protein
MTVSITLVLLHSVVTMQAFAQVRQGFVISAESTEVLLQMVVLDG